METLSALMALSEENLPVTGGIFYQRKTIKMEL